MPLETITIASGQARLAADVAGDVTSAGPVVVFLHAGVADRRLWREQLIALAPRYRAVAYDRRGFGLSLHADEPYSGVGDLLAVLEAVSPGAPAVLVGCSQGGRIAIDTALAHPQRVRALVLVAPAVSGAPGIDSFPDRVQALVDAMEQVEAGGNLDHLNALEAQAWLDGPAAPPGRVSGAARTLFLSMNGIALRAEPHGSEIEPPSAYGRLHELRMPTLLLWGDLDFPHLQARCEHLVQQVPNLRHEVLHGTAHLPSLEQPERVNRALLAFCDALPR